MTEYNEDRRFSSLEEVMKRLVAAEGKSFREIDSTGRINRPGSKRAKGLLGQIIEESVLGYSLNSDKMPDIQVGDDFYELKVTPLKHLRRGPAPKVSAKERLVMDIINYMTLPQERFETSTFWTKAQRMIVVYYYDDRKDAETQTREDCKVLGSFVFHYEPDDLATIRADWEFIHKKVSEGHADELSESDTSYLAACTKGQTAESSLRFAPAPAGSGVAQIEAKQRAFSYKSSFMTAVARRMLNPNGSINRFQFSPYQTLEEYVRLKIGNNRGRTVQDLSLEYGLPIRTANGQSSKSFNQHLTLRLLGTESTRPEEIEQFAAAGVTQVKTTVLYQSGIPEQDMSFPALDEDDWNELADANVQWHDSTLYRFFEETKFCITVFQGQGKKRADCRKEDDTLLGGFLWNMPEADIENYVRPAWETVHNLMANREPTYYNDDSRKNRLPGKTFNGVFHMRPHGRDGKDTIELPNGEEITKQCWWLDRRYIARIAAQNL